MIAFQLIGLAFVVMFLGALVTADRQPHNSTHSMKI